MAFSCSPLIRWFHMVSHAFTHNNKSALRPGAKDQIEAQLVKGLQEDHFSVADKSDMPLIINAFGAVPKKDSNELRMIMDCGSRPLMTNANSYMDLEHYKYVTVDDAANLCQPGCWLAKVDLKHAYRSVGTHPDSWRVTGMSWCFNDSQHPTYLYDKRLPFRARSSPMIFHRLTQAVLSHDGPERVYRPRLVSLCLYLHLLINLYLAQ